MFPQTLPPDFLLDFPKLSPLQAGHLRHFHNLASALPGEWPHMGSQLSGPEWLDSFRYQLATVAYGAAVAHYHRLPALRAPFKTLLEALIGKMLMKEVWAYWYLTSQSGRFVDPDITELRKPWPDPIVRENIMYSGHLLLMVSLHAMLFNDDKYDAPDALTFKWDPIFWGMGPETFSYNRSSLQDAILKEMERENWMGVCCEPNNVFVICNQFPLIAIRYNDIRNKTNIVGPALEKYTAAWKAKGGFHQPDGLFVSMYLVKQDKKIPPRTIGFTAWGCAFMNSWNSEQIHALYPSQSLGFFTPIPNEDRINMNSAAVGNTIRKLVQEENADPSDPATLAKARSITGPTPDGTRFSVPDFGYAAMWLSEVDSPERLNGLLRHADAFLNPTWEEGGLYYPRRDGAEDGEGNWIRVDPFTGNAAIGYARLNVPDGQKKMWERPWDEEYFAKAPYVDGVDLGSGVNFLRGEWDSAKGAMVLTVRTWDGADKTIEPVFCNLPMGNYGVYIGGELVEVRKAEGNIKVTVKVGGADVDVVLLKE
ncbi:hypothetical protein FB45DRAFT_1067234 [Roridomyces roridus]|uniref:Linalool dehydratase/isomerase domain-containing protein n=1 Tax=Roridomyces roridus TaxID=1738132 RepID=A0AAD7F8H7_9AGAR|nr:hypothetical protein FB45DRAFT_1067234 [Roridomyces roridus]